MAVGISVDIYALVRKLFIVGVNVDAYAKVSIDAHAKIGIDAHSGYHRSDNQHSEKRCGASKTCFQIEFAREIFVKGDGDGTAFTIVNFARLF